MGRVPSTALVALGLAALIAARYAAVLGSLGTAFADFEALHGSQLLLEAEDSRLNAWILAWVQHAWTHGLPVFDANAFHPFPGALTGSEHLFGVALQTLPFRVLELFRTNAVALHQLALVLSSTLLAWTSFSFVRWTTGSLPASALAAAASVMMPWRVTELSHVQLSSAQLIPAVWLLVLRGLLEGTRARDLALLFVCTTLQLLSSFYLAYFLSWSSGVMVALVLLWRRPAWRDVARMAAAVAPAYAIFVACAAPYIARQSQADLASAYDPLFSIGIRGALGLVAPHWPDGGAPLNAAASYYVPWGVALLALAAVLMCWRPSPGSGVAEAPGPDRAARMRLATGALAAVVLGCFVLMIGGSARIGSIDLPLPAWALAQAVPGFALLRGPARWAIVIGVAAPLLAGIGAARLASIARDLRHALAAWTGIVLVSALTLDLFVVPVAPAWTTRPSVAKRTEVLASLPPGPVLEIPWAMGAEQATDSSRALLASTLHWRPLVNGYTGHAPGGHAFLERIGERLPGRQALDQLARLTGLRFVVVDVLAAGETVTRRWDAAARNGWLDPIYADADLRVYGTKAGERAGSWAAALVDPTPRATTYSGLSREPLDARAGTGRLEVEWAGLPGPLRGGDRATAVLHVHNEGTRDWPGFDDQEEGLVAARVSFGPVAVGAEAPQGPAATALTSLGLDIPAGFSAGVLVPLHAPLDGGDYRLCIDLVQRVGAELHPLAVEPARTLVRVEEVADATGFARLFARWEKPRAAIPPCR